MDGLNAENKVRAYIGCKIIKAIPMDEISFLNEKREKEGKPLFDNETRPGYKVCYPDGYISWSPKDVFEDAYKEINEVLENFITYKKI